MIHLIYFAKLRSLLGKAEEKMELPDEVSSIGDLQHYLQSKGGTYEQAFSEPGLAAAVNCCHADKQSPVHDLDEIAFFPPIMGG
ncbi:MAG: MoaD/ThiS family protein [Parvibaculales bacterium]